MPRPLLALATAFGAGCLGGGEGGARGALGLAGLAAALLLLALAAPGRRAAAWALLRTPGAFDAREAAFHENVHALGHCKSARLVEVLGRGRGTAAVAARLRQRARAALARFVLPGTEEGLVRAMTLGDRTGIDDATAD